MSIFRFDLGNSTHGPIGLVAQIEAPDAKQATARLQELLEDTITVFDQGNEYVNVYVAGENIHEADAEEQEEA